MIKKKLISRVIVFILTIVLMFTFIPPNLIASALSGTGGGQSQGGSGGGTTGDNDSLWNQEIGLRFSLVTLKNGKRTVVETVSPGKYFIDAWCNGTNLKNIYSVVTNNTRYATENGKGAEYSTIIKDTSSGISSYVNKWLKATYGESKVKAGFNLEKALFDGQADGAAIFNEWTYGKINNFSVYGQKFYNWAMGKPNKVNGEDTANMEAFIKCFYGTKLGGLDIKKTFLTVEPIIYYADLNGTEATGKKSVVSVYGYIDRQQARGTDPGQAWAIHGRLAKIVNGFCFSNVTDNNVKKSLEAVLGLRPPTKDDLYGEDGNFIRFGNTLDSVGLGIQAFWLDDFIDGGLPIDTYDIKTKQPNTPYYPESPKDENNNTGDKTIIKLYTDAYVDPNTGLYTRIEDTAEFAMTGVSDKVTITDESKINGYEVKAWYLSTDAYSSTPKASSMMSKTDFGGSKTDGTVSLSSLGGQQFRVDGYINATGYNINGSKSYFAEIKSPHGPNGNGYTNNTGLPQYTKYKRQDTKVESYYGGVDYKKNDNQKEVVEFGSNDKTIVVLYCREHIELSTGDYSSSTDITNSKDYSTDVRKTKSGNLQIVKLYGVLNPSTYEIKADKSPVIISNATRNVQINNEDNYDLAEWIYLTGGAGTGITAEQMGDPSHYSFDGSADKAYRLDGFVDNFKNNPNYSRAFNFKSGVPTLHILSTNSDGIAETTVPGRYSIGSRSGIGSRAYNSTIYFGGDGKLADETSDSSDTNDVLYMLFLKTDQLSYSTDDLVIPQSYVTRYDNYKHNPMKVTGSVSQTAYNEYLQNHKFKYLLPVVNNKDYEDVNPLFVGQIAIKDKLQSGLIPTYSAVERLEYHGATNQHEILKGYVNVNRSYTFPDYVQLLYIDHNKAITSSNDIANLGNILNLSAVNLEYTAYRSGDSVTAAIWKYNNINSVSGGHKMLATDTGVLLNDFTTMNMENLGGSVAVQGYNKPSTTRQANDSEQNFKLNFNFSEVGNGIKNAWTSTNLKNVAISQVRDRFKMQNVIQQSELTIGNTKLERLGNSGMAGLASRIYFNDKGKDTKAVLSQAFCNKLPGDFEKYSINSLNRLYKIKVNGTWKYAVGATQYLNAASDISITQNVKYGVHYGSAIANPYKDDTKQGNSTDKLRQSGYVKSMKASNTISFYPYYVMQYELPSTYNAQLNKDGTKNSTAGAMNNANQLYVIGEEKRYLNVYNYAEVSFSGHTVSSSKGTDVVNNIVNSNRSGRIEISSEQWSTHARANSLIGLDNCALPGGATLSITIPNDNRQTVTITSYGAFLPEQSAGYAQVKAMNDASSFGTMPTNTDAIKSRHNSLVGSVVGGFEGLNVEQYFTDTKGYTNTKDHGSTYDSANTVYNQISGELGSGKNLYDLPESKRYSVTDFTGKEDKYYYRPDGDVEIHDDGSATKIKLNNFGGIELATGNNNDGKGNTGDFDTNYNDLNLGSSASVTYYTFYMNRVGQVLCIADSNLDSSSRANLTGTTSGDGAVLVAEWSPSAEQHFVYASGLSSDVKQAAINTGIVDELYKQLQEGTGSDQFTPWGTSDGKWYFEAFDGITIAKYTTTLKVGFIDPYERTSVLDPAVVPSMQNKGDMLTSSVVSQIVTSNTSLKYGTVNKIGEFSDENGNKLGDIIMPDLRSFFISDLFFAPNITVQDLK